MSSTAVPIGNVNTLQLQNKILTRLLRDEDWENKITHKI